MPLNRLAAFFSPLSVCRPGWRITSNAHQRLEQTDRQVACLTDSLVQPSPPPPPRASQTAHGHDLNAENCVRLAVSKSKRQPNQASPRPHFTASTDYGPLRNSGTENGGGR